MALDGAGCLHYHGLMRQWRLLKLLLMPSLLSGCLVSLAAAIYLAYAGWEYVQDNGYFYDYLFGAYSARTYLWDRPFTTPPWLANLFGGSLAYFVLLVTAAVIAGVVVYCVLQIISAIRTKTADLVRELEVKSRQHDDQVSELVTRAALRIMALMGWGLYALFYVGVVVELTTIGLHAGLDNIQAYHTALGLVQELSSLGLLIVATYMHVVFLRLCLLRPRVFGGDRAIEEAEERPRSLQ